MLYILVAVSRLQQKQCNFLQTLVNKEWKAHCANMHCISLIWSLENRQMAQREQEVKGYTEERMKERTSCECLNE